MKCLMFKFWGSRSKGKGISIGSGKFEIEGSKGGDCVDVDGGLKCKGSSDLYFLKRVLCKEMGTDFSDTKLVFLAVHAVFLDSGFIGFDPLSGLRVDLFETLEEQSSIAFTKPINYTLPELLSRDNVADSVVLKFRTLGRYVNVYGSLSSNPERIHELSIDKTRFAPIIGHFRETDYRHDRLNDGKDSTKANDEVIFEFWKIVKDGLALHLMIDLCEKTGLDLPPCLMVLPGDIKFRILELLSGQDTARVACVCKEMNNLSSKDELWKEKYMSEYGNRTGTVAGDDGNWKGKFVFSWKNSRRENYGLKVLDVLEALGDMTALLTFLDKNR